MRWVNTGQPRVLLTCPWRRIVQIAEAGDPITDPTELWPDSREMIQVGTLTVTEAAGQDCDDLMFSPVALPEGIEPSDDPILHIRTPVYADSFMRRQ